MASKTLINLSNLQQFLSKLNEKFALKKTMKGISEDSEGNIIKGEEGLVPTPNENSKGKFLRSDGEWALPSETAVYDSMTIEEGVAGVSEVDKVLNAKNLKQIVNSDGFLTSLDSSKLTGVINIENLPQGALERILIVSSKEERLTLSDTEVQLGDVVKESDTGLMYYVINTEKLNSEEGYTQFTAGMASSVPWSGVTDKPTIPTKTSDLTNDSGFAIDSNVVHKSGDETINGIKTFNNTVVQKKDGIFKNDNVDITTTPSSNLFSHVFFVDKNSVANAFIRYAQRTNGINELNLFVRDKDLNNYGVAVNTNNEFLPVLNNTYSLGSSSLKWANVYSTNDITNMVITYAVTNHNNTSTMTVCGGSSWDTGSTLFLYGNSHSKYPGAFDLTAKNTTNECKLIGFPNGTLTWNGKNIALDENLVHRSGDETIAGNKTFSNRVSFPSGYYITTDTTDNSLRISRSGTNHGNNYKIIIQGDNGKIFAPNGFQGNLQGNADTATSATKATQDSAGQQINKTYIKELSVSGRTITYKRGDNTTGTITTQDTNTTYSKLSQFTNDSGFITSSGSCKYATSAGSAGNGVDSWGGSWIRFKNGIQMCWGAGTFEETISYPKAFKVNPALICTPFSELQQSLVVDFCLKTNTLFACRVWNIHAGTWQTDGYYDWVAIGIWK